MRTDNFVAECLFRLIRHRAVRHAAADEAAGSTAGYAAWRGDELERRFGEFVDPAALVGKDVLDFGCGSGGLALAVARLGARSVCGIDLDAASITEAAKAADDSGRDIDFRLATRTDAIEFADNSFDVILCFDVLEHVIEYESIIGEWRRVLRPGGRILISWTPYWHPYGHHLHRYAPIPWMHAFCSGTVMNMVCSKIVNLAEFSPPFVDLDEAGRRRDRFAGSASFDFLNRLTTARFERLCAKDGLGLLRRGYRPLGPLRRFPLAGRVCGLPWLREFTTACALYEIVSP